VNVLCIGLRFRPEFTLEQWTRTLRAILEWEPSLAPTHVHRRDDPAAVPREPWTDALWPELSSRLAGPKPFSWGLEHLDGVETSLDAGRGLHQNDVLIALDKPRGSLVRRFESLLAALQGAAVPALGFLYECQGPDAELAMQGMQRLDRLPPVLYLDQRAAERLGGLPRLRDAPADVHPSPGGLIIELRDPFDAPSPDDQRRAESLAAYLGLAEDRPLSFV